MATKLGTPTLVTAEIEPTVPISRGRRTTSVSERYSSPLISQNAPHQATGFTNLNNYLPPTYQYYQDFTLPKDFTRGPSDAFPRIPPLTGISLFVSVNASVKDVAAFDWIVQRYAVGSGWQTLGEGTAVGAATEGEEVWIDAYFNEPIDIVEDWLSDRFRFGVRGRNPSSTTFKEVVPWTNNHVTVEGQQLRVSPKVGVPYHFTLPGDSTPRVLHRDAATNKVYHSVQRGVRRIWATHPNPLARMGGKAYLFDGTTPLTIEGQETSLMFRVLAGTADSGTDFLGNTYRSVISRNTAANVSGVDSATQDRFWISRPNPSKFAVESMYFDMSLDEEPQTMDRILVDPITPGVYFSVYWSNEGDPGADEEEWDEKLWTRVDQTFQMKRRETHALPVPITARYLKVDFTQLQAKTYDPGHFHKPTVYKKHPKWVLDYFMARLAVDDISEDKNIAGRVRVDFDFYDFAYNYYLDDLRQEPLTPADIGTTNANDLNSFLTERRDSSDTVDQATFARIRRVIEPYTNHRAAKPISYLPSLYSLSPVTKAGDIFFPAQHTNETLTDLSATTNQVSTLDRSRVVIEKNFPVMFFYVPARHRYRLVSAKYTHNRAYFAGIKEIALFRERYPVAHDTPIYIEAAGDRVNLERSDFVRDENTWVTYSHDAT